MTAALMLLPEIVLLVLGALVGRRVPAAAWAGIDRLNFVLLFPALIFSGAASRPIAWSLAATLGLGVWAVMLGGLVLAYPLRRFGPTRFIDFAGAWQTAWRFNTAVAFAVAAILPPEEAALMPVAVGLAVPVANLFAVGALGRGGAAGIAAITWSIATNPFLLASLAGLAVGLANLTLPELLAGTAARLGAAAVPLALLSIGATLEPRALLRLDRFAMGMNAVKLVALPGIAWAIGLAVGLAPPLANLLIVFAALPTASAAPVLAAAFGVDPRLSGQIVAQSTLLAGLTLPVWITVAG